MNSKTSARNPSLRSWLLVLVCLSTLLSLEATSPGQSSQNYQQPTDQGRSFYRIDVEDSIEAGLIEQELKVKPVLIRSRAFYYYGNEEANQLLRRYGYEPVRVKREDVLTRLVMVIRKKGTEEDLAK